MFLLATGGLAALTIDLGPDVASPMPPSVADAAAARGVVRQISGALERNETPEIIVNAREIAAGTRLLNNAAGRGRRLAVHQDGGALELTASAPLAAGLWINMGARLLPSQSGFPQIKGRIGRLPVPAFIMRWLAERALAQIAGRGKDLPPLDQLVNGLTVTDGQVRARLNVRAAASIFDAINPSPVAAIDPKDVAAHYCRIAQMTPSDELAPYVQRAFSGTPKAGQSLSESHRATFVALAMIIVSPKAGRMVAGAETATEPCRVPVPGAMLLARADLAQHWTLSAALAATFGGDLSNAMGTWKELSDSTARGSGFSFVDLAADRAGVRYALRGSSPGTAKQTRAALSTADDATLLPLRAMALQEGMSEAEFTRRFKTITSQEYGKAVAQIDAMLEKTSAR